MTKRIISKEKRINGEPIFHTTCITTQCRPILYNRSTHYVKPVYYLCFIVGLTDLDATVGAVHTGIAVAAAAAAAAMCFE